MTEREHWERGAAVKSVSPPKSELRELPIELLQPASINPRPHQVTKIIASIQRFGFRSPLVVNETEGHYIVEAGHGRLLAAQRLGLKSLPCIIVHDDEQTAAAYNVADNRIQEFTEWDQDDLQKLLTTFNEDLRSVIGFPVQPLPDFRDAVTPADITAHAEKLDNQMRRLTDNSESQMIDLVCPECGKEFRIMRGELDKSGLTA